MALPLLSTKFYIPPERAGSVARPRLTQRLLAGVHRPQSFTLLSGPAGSGKTTLLSQFVAQVEQPVAWLSLDQADDEPGRFWTYLISACQAVLPGLGQPALALLNNGQPLPAATIPTILINDLATREAPLVLILDDYHLIHNQSIHESLSYLLDYLPASLHVVLSTRTDPPWPLARYRARNRLGEIRAHDLRFNQQETAQFLNQTMQLDLPPEAVAALAARTEGWAAGLQLAAIALQSPPAPQPQTGDATTFVQDFAGSHLFVAEYLIEEVLRRQPPAVQNFLVETSILTRFNYSLCEDITEQEDAQDTLAALRHANLFLIPLDQEGQWFRYHHLFADLLQARLRQERSPEDVATLHKQAAGWYERNGFPEDAVHHALEAQDFAQVAALVDRLGQTMLFTDQYWLLKRWLDALPPDILAGYPRLQIFQILIDLTRGTIDMAEQTLRDKEKLIDALPHSPTNDRLRVEAKVYLALFLAFQNTSRAIQIAETALPKIPEEDQKRRAYLFSALYRGYGMEGNYGKAAQAYRESLRLAQAAGYYGMAANTTMIRAFDLCQYGRLDEAAHYCQVILEAGSRNQTQQFYAGGPAHIGLAGIYLERNQLEPAAAHLEQGLQLARLGDLFGLFTGHAQKARLHQARGEFEQALQELEFVDRTFQRREFTLVARHVSLRLAMGDLPAATALETQLRSLFGDSAYAQKLPRIAMESLQLSLARLLLARQETGEAGKLLDEIETTVTPDKRFGRLLEVYLLRALLLHQEQPAPISTEALNCLQRALELGQPAGFILLFLEEGPPLVPLLHALSARPTTPAPLGQYACTLLAAFGEEVPEAGQAPAPGQALVEPLTPREQEVLQLIADGHSNRSIAEQLVVTVRTVKKHASNIYGKLEVANRTQAAARARELGLLAPK